MLSRKRISAALIGLILLAVVGWFVQDMLTVDDAAPTPSSLPDADSGLQVETLSSFPLEVNRIWTSIERGGPFPYVEIDGVTFGNRENVLPHKPTGYSWEYPVATPSTKQREPRKLVTGDRSEVGYTEDYYASFVVMDTQR